MSESRESDGPNWRDNPDEYKPPRRRSDSFLASRGYENPEITAVKFGLAEAIGRGGPSGHAHPGRGGARVRAAGVPLPQPNVSVILTG